MNVFKAIAAATSLAFCLLSPARADMVTDWNDIAIRATDMAGLPPPPQTRAMAMVHAAIYDAVNAVERRHAPYAVDLPAPAGTSAEAAVAAAAHGILTGLFPLQRASLDGSLNTALSKIAEGSARTEGIALGKEVATRIFDLRKGDGVGAKVSYALREGPGAYQVTPPMNAQPVIPQWGGVKPFLLRSAVQFDVPGPPAPGSAEFMRDFNEVKSFGGRGSTTRTNEQTATAIFWAGSEIPPLNAIARSMAAARKNTLIDNARLFAYLNMAMADSLIAGFEVKYRFNHWRPVTAIRNAAQLQNLALTADAKWEPLLVTPPHPEYPSAHCLATGAAEVVLRQFFGTDAINTALVLPAPLGVERRYTSLAQLVKEMEDARVWGGIHFRTADEHGTHLGKRIAEFAMRQFLRPAAER